MCPIRSMAPGSARAALAWAGVHRRVDRKTVGALWHSVTQSLLSAPADARRTQAQCVLMIRECPGASPGTQTQHTTLVVL